MTAHPHINLATGQGVPPLRAVPGPGLPVEKMLLGKPVAEAAALLPRLFNLCRAAQDVAVSLALDLPGSNADITAEIRRDHIVKLFVSWPGYFGARGQIDPAILTDDQALRVAVFGPTGQAPKSADEVASFLASDVGVAPLFARIESSFASGEAVANDLPIVDEVRAFQCDAVENSTAARRATHPAMTAIETHYGRGPLWRAFGRALDLVAVVDGDMPPPISPAPGKAVVPATRGTYAVSAQAVGGFITHFDRVTPTDHLTAKGGMLDRTLASLPADKTGLAPLILDVLDPCSPVRLEEVAHA